MEHNPFSRTQQLIGKEGLVTLNNTKVAVFGIGGVGSYVAEGLARAGVGHLYLIDDDVVRHSNINRQIHANYSTLDQPKVVLMKDRILSINPKAEVVIHQKRYNSETAEELFPYGYDYIVDAIDSVSSKIDLILRAIQNHIPIVSSMGTGNKLDPTRFEVTDISKTSICPLARVMRRELKRRGVTRLKVIYSKEQPIKPLEPEKEVFEDEYTSGDRIEPQENTNWKHLPGSISFVPSVAGLILAGEVVRDVLGIKRS